MSTHTNGKTINPPWGYDDWFQTYCWPYGQIPTPFTRRRASWSPARNDTLSSPFELQSWTLSQSSFLPRKHSGPFNRPRGHPTECPKYAWIICRHNFCRYGYCFYCCLALVKPLMSYNITQHNMYWIQRTLLRWLCYKYCTRVWQLPWHVNHSKARMNKSLSGVYFTTIGNKDISCRLALHSRDVYSKPML